MSIAPRSYLYAPGSSDSVMRKALGAGADAVVFDLEDAVPAGGKDEARQTVRALLEELDPAGEMLASGPAVHVRINRGAEGYVVEDLAAVVQRTVTGVRLPKAESPQEIVAVSRRVEELERQRGLEPGQIGLYPIIESASGALQVAELAASSGRIRRVAFGASDFLADIGAAGDDELATLHVRSLLVLASRHMGIGAPVDSVYTDLDDDEGLRRTATRARGLGFFGKSVIHPGQIAVVHDIFSPSEAEIADARRVLSALADAEGEGRGAVRVDGKFIDAAVAARARAVIERTRRT